MSQCALCHAELAPELELCAYHRSDHPARWADTNRIMCDLLHRQRVPPRLPAHERDDEVMPGLSARTA